MATLILTDNVHAHAVALELQASHDAIDVYQSQHGELPEVPRLNVMERIADIIEQYDLVFSLHCKQRFPARLIDRVRCVNVHPGLNPYNRGWYPQVFSIINGLKAGVTIHEIDEELDHGPIIAQKECPIESWDSSGSVYARLMDIERELVLEYFPAIRGGSYHAEPPAIEGNLNLKQDFERLRQLDLNEQATFGEFLNRLRALTHDDFQNAWFVDASGRKVFVRLLLEPEKA
ncbi:dTDP-4-amino-4,6-dideoxyglucose formyltransferase [Mycobacterium spongiae]|uniref:dTDP-4-amino-4,6-dideoxyglucose formyltransferase n=1 Tax=Mycobacterium spongiae TaxID=886343 RepID=A0A975PX57_9MYCO|nr:dTDP-4-amino-4,6-dideoxyglucose formyltransferase [Mycobacterium spongiae]QUR67752.1 dTDP-4-amino-4,6-dideoxyglucose formyltransferase [Mycobacterium spongiae]